jgi:glycosyltransferase involved in cell wall biosynthesis
MSLAIETERCIASKNSRRVIPVSVLMATYAGETAGNLHEALESVFTQTVRPLEIVIVLDGPVGMDQQAILRLYETRSAEIPIECVRLETNLGLANALNIGLGRCRGRYVCRMDSDDVCMPQRLERQWAVAECHSEFDCIGSWHLEFETQTSACDRLKTTPEYHDEIVRALKWRNVFSHPTMFVKTDALRYIAGYRDYKLGLPSFGKTLFEDYDCLIRLIKSDYQLYAIQEPLLYFRRTPAQMKRRGGLSFLIRDVAFRLHHIRTGFFSPGHVIVYIPIAFLCHLAPSSLRGLLYLFVRRRVSRPRGVLTS